MLEANTFYERLREATRADREKFQNIPLVRTALSSGVSRRLYLAFLTQAYHHVKHTFPLLALAASQTDNPAYQAALLEYMREERGHEHWILDDIRALGGDAEAVRTGTAGHACRLMVGHAYYAIERVSCFAMLGSVFVLEGMSMALADAAASKIQQSIGQPGPEGFSYLRSHGSLDIEHVAFFENLVNDVLDDATFAIVVDHARIFFRLYGDIFRDLGEVDGALANVA